MSVSHQKSRRHAAPSPVPAQAPAAVKAGTQGGGTALDRRTQNQMSARFGHNFSQVRIHTDARAGESAAAMGANAYALGSNIVFGSGKYTPGSRETDRLLAHELTHVVQQSRFGAGDWGRTSRKGDASEREADGLASQVMMGRSVSVQAATGAAVARDEDDGSGGGAFIGPPAPDPGVDPATVSSSADAPTSYPGDTDAPSGPPTAAPSSTAPPQGTAYSSSSPDHFFGLDGSGSWMDKTFGLDPTKSFQETTQEGLLGPNSYAQAQPGDSTGKTLSRAAYSIGAGFADGVATPAADLLDTLAYGPMGLGEDRIKKKPDGTSEAQ